MDKHNLVRHVLRMQRKIAHLLFLVFLILVIYALTPWAQDQVLNIFVPVVVGWLGAIIGFYFSKEVGNAIEQRIMGVKSDWEAKIQTLTQDLEVSTGALRAAEERRKAIEEKYHQLEAEQIKELEALRKYY
ncbi:MAG TPA: hypothetical protein VJ044_03740 [Candidatus Hodarchaeales archaeon]|nr:hypothetical protein [Candidatus Hodarchaeales archaeon]HLC84535.1 hypothetical protein [Candidatus Nanoarchaeia archaeon]